MAKIKLADIRVGGIFKLKTDQYAGYGLTKGDQVEITYIQGSSIQCRRPKDPTAQQLSIQISQLDFYTQSKTQIEAQIKEAQAAIEIAKGKLKWMQETNSEEFDEDEFKVWHTLTMLEDTNTTKVQKAKAIAQLIKNG